MKLTAPINVPIWLQHAARPAASIVLLLCAIDFLNWQFVGPQLRYFDLGEPRCFDNAEPMMPLAEIVHAVLCAANRSPFAETLLTVSGELTRLCLYGGVILVWLAARAISGWWSAGIAAALVSTSPFLFVLDNQMSPATLGLLFATLSCWLAAEEFGRQKRGAMGVGQLLWSLSALLAIGMYVATAWLILAQGIYALVQRRQIIGSRIVACTVVMVSAAAALAAFIPTDAMSSAVVRADIRAAPQNMFAFSYPDEWMSQPHMATYLTIGFLFILVLGAIAARATLLPYLVVAVCLQAFIAAAFSVGTLAKVTSLAYAVPMAGLAFGAITEFLIGRKPHMLAFVLPAFAVAAQYAAFGRLHLLDDEAFNFDNASPPPVAAYARTELLRLNHDPRHAEYLTVFRSFDGLRKNRDKMNRSAAAPAVMGRVVPYRVNRHIYYADAVSARDASWRGFAYDSDVWPEPPPGRCVRQPNSKMRLYERPDVSFREDGHSTPEAPGTVFQVIGINQETYQPELHVRVVHGADVGREGWIYAQVIMLGDAGSANRAVAFSCDP